MDQQQAQAKRSLKAKFDKPKSGEVIPIIGQQGMGKTPVAQQLAIDSGFANIVVYDPNGEYDPDECTVFYDLAQFKKFLSSDDSEECFIICEEATTFCDTYDDDELTNLIVRIQHKLSVMVFLFHSLIDASPYILRKCRFAILLPTNDEPETIKRSRTKFYKYFIQSLRGYDPAVVGSGDVYIDFRSSIAADFKVEEPAAEEGEENVD